MFLHIVLLTIASASREFGRSMACDKRDLTALMVRQNLLRTTIDEHDSELLTEIKELSEAARRRTSILNITVQKANADTYHNSLGLNTTIIALRSKIDMWKQELNKSDQASHQLIDNLLSKIQGISNQTNSLSSVADEIVKDLHGLSAEIKTIKELSQCPDGWVFFNKSCYLVSVSLSNFNDAAKTCSDLGAHLVYVDSETENNFLKKYLASMKDGLFWMGLSDAGMEGTWVYYGTNIQSRFFDWKENEPNDVYNNEDCAHFWPFYSFQWNDTNCESPLFFVCENEYAS